MEEEKGRGRMLIVVIELKLEPSLEMK